MNEKLKIKKLDPDAKVPTYQYEHDAGLDLYAIEDHTLEPGKRTRVRTGIAMEIPLGYVGLVWDKSGISMNHGIKTLGGVIDAGYRGELQIGLVNHSDETYEIKKGDKITQLLIQKVEHPEIEEVRDLSDTERAERGFGSSGK